jgi:drug/metabolite transporter (DMT)-like permease
MKNEKYLGVVLIILSALFFALMATTVKSVSNFPLVQKVFFRNFVGVVLLSFYMIKHKNLLKINHKPLLLSRCLFGLTGVFLYYRSLELLNLSEAVVINKLSPFFVVLLGGLLLKEKIKPLQVFAVFLALAGTVALVRPTTDVNLLPALTGLGGALAAASAYTIIRHLRRYDKPITIVFYFCLLSTMVTLPLLIPVFVMPTWIEAMKLIMIGVFALAAQLLMTQAYHYAPASQLSIYTYLNIVFSTLLGFFIYKELIQTYFIIGAGMIILGGVLNFYAHKPKKLKNQQS